MLKLLAKLYLRTGGWRITGERPNVRQCIMIVMPHTSQYDFILGKCFGIISDMKPKVLIRKESFFFPLGLILKAMGGIAVDRTNNRRLAQQLIAYMRENESFSLVITPEGTRKKVKRLRRGFYHIAQATGLPVYMAYIDFKARELGIGPELPVTGNFDADLKILKDFYRGMEGKHPEKFDADDLS